MNHVNSPIHTGAESARLGEQNLLEFHANSLLCPLTGEQSLTKYNVSRFPTARQKRNGARSCGAKFSVVSSPAAAGQWSVAARPPGLRSCEIIPGRARAFHAKAQSRRRRKENKTVVLCESLRVFAPWRLCVRLFFFRASERHIAQDQSGMALASDLKIRTRGNDSQVQGN